MKTALTQYIEDLKTGNCKGEEYYLELEKQQIIEVHICGDQIRTSTKHLTKTKNKQRKFKINWDERRA